MTHAVITRRGLLGVFVSVVHLTAAGCVATVEESIGGDNEEWTTRSAIEGGEWDEDEGWQQDDQLLELVHGTINERRHDAGLSTLRYDITLEPALPPSGHADFDEVGTGVVVDDDPFYCSNKLVKVHVITSYDSKYDEEDGLLINADHSTIASDVVDAMEEYPEQRDILFSGDFSSYAAQVSVGDHGRVYVPQAFCSP